MRWLLAAIGALAAASAAAMGGQNMVLGRIVVPRADAPSLTVASSPRGHFVLHCAGCHRADGSGAPDKYVPDLRRLGSFLRLEGGREFVIGVPGVMGSGLDDAQVAEVTNWLLATVARDSVPDGHRPYTAAEVAATRSRPMPDVAAVRHRLVEQARARGIAID
jgi:mono/diheme cytochrome c family protein